jgi:hypothetical protein
MKKFIFPALVLTLCFCVAQVSCKTVKHDNGKHKGWFKNKNNPHNPAHDGKNKGNSKGNSKKK